MADCAELRLAYEQSSAALDAALMQRAEAEQRQVQVTEMNRRRAEVAATDVEHANQQVQGAANRAKADHDAWIDCVTS